VSTKNNNHHLLAIFFLSLKYIFPIIIFGKITIFYIDTLDSEIVYNYILGKIYKGETNAIEYFLAGEIKLIFLRRLFQPFSLFYLLNKFNWSGFIKETAHSFCIFSSQSMRDS
jgi:hypothetical protein